MTTLSEAFRNCWLIATIGVVLFLSGTAVLFWNEGRAVHTIMSLDEALDNAVSIEPAAMESDYDYNGRIVHVVGPIIIGEPLTEPDYNIQVLAVKLKRRVQMYQWVEESIEHNYANNIDTVETESRTYYYTMEWRDRLIDSRQFYIQTGHRNPDKFPIESAVQVADAVFIGKYELGSAIKEKFNNYVEMTGDQRPEDTSIKLHLGLYYHSNDVFNPSIGDVRLLFTVAGLEGEVYTIVGKMENNKIVPYKTKRGVEVLLVYSGEHSIISVFKQEHQTQRLTTWGFRFLGWVLVFFGVTCTSTLLHIILMRVRLLSALAPDPNFPVGANFLLSFSMAMIIAAVAWVLHRPVIGASLIFAAASPFVWCAHNVAQYQRLSS